jgi:hypothetical protein
MPCRKAQVRSGISFFQEEQAQLRTIPALTLQSKFKAK